MRLLSGNGYDRRQALAWAMYDWANSAFAMTVMAAFFPIFLGQYWIGGSGVNATFVLGAAN
ncbi:MAG TPA: MFS transporter, partial [Xanthomonadaceae bacterium]|nr:MFS transporter [Xanthomonadaceae bacterium]